MPFLRYVSHPEVVIDAAVPVPEWRLTPTGRDRVAAMCAQPWLSTVTRVVSSDETKAREAAAIVGAHLGFEVEVRPDTGETDRSATGFIPPNEYGPVSTRWFASPDESPDGWEPARAVQRRIADALDDLLASDTDVLVVGHGGAGTLLYCLLAGRPIAESEDQPGAGHYFTVDLESRTPTHAWRPIDVIEPGAPLSRSGRPRGDGPGRGSGSGRSSRP